MIAETLSRAREGGWIAASGVLLALVLGGGGSPAPLAELALQLAIALLALAWWQAPGPSSLVSLPRPVLAIAVLLIALPLMQLIPLPPALWQSLPGRELAQEALALTGSDGQWMPLSLAPDRTLAALLAVLPAVAVLIMTSELGEAGRARILLALIAGLVLTLLLGAAQVSGGPDSLLRLYGRGGGALEGFQANRNSTADVILIGMLAAIAAMRAQALAGHLPNRPGPVLAMALGVIAVGAIGVAMTTSRAGIALLLVALATIVGLLRPWLGTASRRLSIALLGLAGTGLAALSTFARSEALSRVVDRFAFSAELRPDLWRDSLYAAQHNFPFGVGMGNFVPALVASERLEVLRETMPNRAHNELLELAVEGGVFGLGLAAALIAIVMTAVIRAWRAATPGSAGTVLFAASALTILALHSLVDYPFRSMALAIVAAACTGMVMPRRVAPAVPDSSDRLKEDA